MAAGLISKDEFLLKASDICQRSEHLEDGWTLQKIRDDMVLCKTVIQQVDRNLDLKKDEEVAGKDPALDVVEDGLEDNDGACLTIEAPCLSEALRFEYHVVYSESYSVPVLYLNVTKSDGQLVSLTELWDLIPLAYRERLEEDKWTFLTQQEHPLLGRPFYQLHPCHTEKLMSSVVTQDGLSDPDSCKRNYLITWLSSVGPVVHLNLPLDYGKVP